MESTTELIELYLREKAAIASSFPVDDLVRLVEAVCDAYEHDGSVYTFANGGPAGIAENFATDLTMHPFVSDDKSQACDIRRIRVHCLNESPGVLTAVANDIGYESIFAEQLKNYLRNPDVNGHDVVLGFSGSGNSANVLNAFEYAKQFGVTTACVAGRGGGKARELADICVIVPGSSRFPGQTGANDNNFHIEDFQCSITHIITGILKDRVMHQYG